MLDTATFAAGCFWGVEELFRELPGVQSTMVGYTGGSRPNPTYEAVCTDTTGHVEAVQIVYDPAVVSYDKLLNIFWDNHNPTTVDRQGPDVGSQYRSAIFYHSPEQQHLAEVAKAALEASGKWAPRPIVTQVVPASEFFKAEDYHQQYLAKRGLGSCRV